MSFSNFLNLFGLSSNVFINEIQGNSKSEFGDISYSARNSSGLLLAIKNIRCIMSTKDHNQASTQNLYIAYLSRYKNQEEFENSHLSDRPEMLGYPVIFITSGSIKEAVKYYRNHMLTLFSLNEKKLDKNHYTYLGLANEFGVNRHIDNNSRFLLVVNHYIKHNFQNESKVDTNEREDLEL